MSLPSLTESQVDEAISAAGGPRRLAGGARPRERVQHRLALERVELDEPLGQRLGEGRRVPDALLALGAEDPHAAGGSHELIG